MQDEVNQEESGQDKRDGMKEETDYTDETDSSELNTDRMSFAGLQRAPDCLFSGKADVTQWQTHLADWVVPGETIVVENLHVQSPAHQLVVRKTCSSSSNCTAILVYDQIISANNSRTSGH